MRTKVQMNSVHCAICVLFFPKALELPNVMYEGQVLFPEGTELFTNRPAPRPKELKAL